MILLELKHAFCHGCSIHSFETLPAIKAGLKRRDYPTELLQPSELSVITTVDSMLGQEERKSRMWDKGRCRPELRTSESVGHGDEKQQVKTQS